MAAIATSIPVKLIIGTGDAQIELGEAQLPFDAALDPDSFALTLDSPSLRAGLVELFREAADQLERGDDRIIQLDELAARRELRGL